MTTLSQQSAAMRFVEMAIDHKKLGKAQEAYRIKHKADLLTAYHEAQRALEAKES
jgi:hypothetical protein